MSEPSEAALALGKSITGRTILPVPCSVDAWANVSLSHLNASLKLLAREQADGGLSTVCSIAARLGCNFSNPVHYGDNKPGFFDSLGRPFVPDPQFTYWDLISLGLSGEGGRLGFLQECKLPADTRFIDLLLATGLLLVDSAVEALESGAIARALYLAGQAHDCMEDARLYVLLDKDAEATKAAIQNAIKLRASVAGRAKHAKDKDGKQAVKALVKGRWRAWKENPKNYKTIARFANDMTQKWPDQLTSTDVVERWVREWNKESSG